MIKFFLQFSLIFLASFGLVYAEPASILFTGNTKSYLEPCGCVEGMLGGIARRPMAMKSEKNFLLVDSGNFVELEGSIDRLRNEYYAKSFRLLGYSAIGLGSSEVAQSSEFLKGLESSSKFVLSNVKQTPAVSWLKSKIEAQGIQFLSLVEKNTEGHKDFEILDPVESAKKLATGNQIVLFSSLESSSLESVLEALGSKVKLVIANQARGQFEKIKGVPVAHPGDKGKMVKKYSFKSGEYSSLAVLDTYEQDNDLKKVVDDFYLAVEKDPELQKDAKPLFTEDPLEKQVIEGKNFFVGSVNCKSCHQKEYDQFNTTAHAKAFDILLEKKRDFVPECVSCHSVGLGLPTGYEIAKRQAHLKGVGCESCHGAGGQHVRNPTKTNIVKEVPQSRCMSCHNPEHSPYFNYTAMTPLVNHSFNPHENKEEEPPKKSEKVQGELYVMSQCPFGIKAENKLLPIAKKFKEGLDLDIHFIATDVEGKISKEQAEESEKLAELQKEKEKVQNSEDSNAPGCKANFEIDPNAKFQALHGQPEVDENMRQVIVERLYPDKYFDFILERNKNIYGPWEPVAKKLNMDSQAISNAMTDGRGDAWFRENIKPGNDLGISASPTLRLNEQAYRLPFEPIPLAYQICARMENPIAECADIPVCSADSHCSQSGKNGFCRNPGTKEARCEFEDPVEVPVVVIQDKDCDLCESGQFLAQLHQVFPGLQSRVISSDSFEAQGHIRKLQADRFPLYLFPDDSVRKSPRVKSLQRYLAFSQGMYFINPLINQVSSLNRKPKLMSLKLYTTSLASSANLQKDLVKMVRELEEEAGKKVDFQIVPLVNQARVQPNQTQNLDQYHKVNYSDGKGNSFPVYVESRNGKKELLEGIVQLCAQDHLKRDQLFDYYSLMSGKVFDEYSQVKDRNALKAVAQKMDVEGLRRQVFREAQIIPAVQQKISQCVASEEGSKKLLMSLIETSQLRVVAAPTVVINDYYMVRGMSPALLGSLKDILKTNKYTPKIAVK